MATPLALKLLELIRPIGYGFDWPFSWDLLQEIDSIRVSGPLSSVDFSRLGKRGDDIEDQGPPTSEERVLDPEEFWVEIVERPWNPEITSPELGNRPWSIEEISDNYRPTQHRRTDDNPEVLGRFHSELAREDVAHNDVAYNDVARDNVGRDEVARDDEG
ncbi:hypothetical protein K440DRAFT_660811 [Wilcoxina mikolae CBS 423.85]|nr:hypothetical protein K440DRAFT_660811 [Wilcoxina mikolae CBS 423.85]